MADPAFVHVALDLRPSQAYALAELCKRISWSDCEKLSVDRTECEAMIAATDRVRAALDDAGVRVR
jgi:hypothetical protein